MPLPELSRGERRCLNLLRSYLYGKDYCWVRQKIIAEKMGVGLRTIKRHYAALAAAGEIKIHKRGGQQSALVTVTSAVTSAVTSETLQSVVQGASNTRFIEETVASETPHRKPEVNLKTTKKYQSKCTVQEQREPTAAVTEPSYEEAQTEAVAEAVRWCGFEATPDLIARLEDKRRFYGATGFKVAAIITRAYKLVQGTSNTPRSQAWFTTVVENALKVDKLPPTHIVSRPMQPGCVEPHVSTSSAPATDVAPPVGPQLVARPVLPCVICSGFGIVGELAGAAWCSCSSADARKLKEPDAVDKQRRAARVSRPAGFQRAGDLLPNGLEDGAAGAA